MQYLKTKCTATGDAYLIKYVTTGRCGICPHWQTLPGWHMERVKPLGVNSENRAADLSREAGGFYLKQRVF